MPFAPSVNRQPTLQEILGNTAPVPWTLSAFMAFLSQNHCLKTLEFTMDIQRYTTHYRFLMGGPPISLDCKYLCMLWEKLLGTYVASNGPREISLPNDIRDHLPSLPCVDTPPDASELESAARINYELMGKSVLVPFINSVAPVRALQPLDSLWMGDEAIPYNWSPSSARSRNHTDGGINGHDTFMQLCEGPSPRLSQQSRFNANLDHANSSHLPNFLPDSSSVSPPIEQLESLKGARTNSSSTSDLKLVYLPNYSRKFIDDTRFFEDAPGTNPKTTRPKSSWKKMGEKLSWNKSWTDHNSRFNLSNRPYPVDRETSNKNDASGLKGQQVISLADESRTNLATTITATMASTLIDSSGAIGAQPRGGVHEFQYKRAESKRKSLLYRVLNLTKRQGSEDSEMSYPLPSSSDGRITTSQADRSPSQSLVRQPLEALSKPIGSIPSGYSPKDASLMHPKSIVGFADVASRPPMVLTAELLNEEEKRQMAKYRDSYSYRLDEETAFAPEMYGRHRRASNDSGNSGLSTALSTAQSISTIASLSSMSSVLGPEGAAERLIEVLLGDSILRKLYQEALSRVTVERLERNLHRMFKLFAIELHKEAKTPGQRGAARFVRNQARNSAHIICNKLGRGTSVVEPKSLNPTIEPTLVTQDVLGDESDDDSDSDSRDDDPVGLEQLERFIVATIAFESLRSNLRLFVYPVEAGEMNDKMIHDSLAEDIIPGARDLEKNDLHVSDCQLSGTDESRAELTYADLADEGQLLPHPANVEQEHMAKEVNEFGRHEYGASLKNILSNFAAAAAARMLW
ncbi:hypothetical protein B0O99DRAFT_686792 [Bisporella sp. PMI_857]|nr:hypothetical protein B0O99DRAFT_686792 [Bisporella sp. PMI_857]